MSIDRYLRAFAHYWYVPLAFVLAGILGTWIYLRVNLGQKAVVTVAVLEPAITNNLEGEQAQINFASIVESRTVSERVVRRLDLAMEPEALQNDIEVELARTLIPSVASPLYTVEVENPDAELALAIAGALVDESGVVFQQLNALDVAALDAIADPQEAALRDQLAVARGDLRSFEDSSQTWLLPLQIQLQVELIKLLRESAGFAPVTEAVEQELQATLSLAQSELDTLYVLLPEYERLSLDAALAIDRMLILADARALRDFSLRPSAASTEIEASLEEWHQARTALLEYIQGEGESDDLTTEASDAYQRWSTARTAVLQSIAAEIELSEAGAAATGAAAEPESTLGLIDLPERLDSQQSFVEAVQFMLLSNRIERVGYEAAVAAEEAELRRLLNLVPEYEVLASRVDLLEQALRMGAARKAELIFQGSLPPAAQIKLLDSPHIESSLLDVLFPIALSGTFTVAAAAGAVYLLAYFVHVPFSSEDVKEWLGTPVLADLPRGEGRA